MAEKVLPDVSEERVVFILVGLWLMNLKPFYMKVVLSFDLFIDPTSHYTKPKYTVPVDQNRNID